MYNMHWSVLVCIVCNGLYWYVFACNGTNGIVHIDEYWLYLCVLLCFGMYCMYKRYCMYWSVLISIWPAVLQIVCTVGTYWQYLYVFACVDVCYCVSLHIACISMYRVNGPLAPQECIVMFARNDLKVFACIGLHCVHLPVLLVVVCIDKGASVDWYHAKDLHHTYQYLHDTCILIQCYTAFHTICLI